LTRYVIGPDVALRLARDAAVIGAGQQLLAPALPQADAFVTLDQRLARAVKDLVTVAPIEALR
jgi:hypothetical protein